MNGAHGKSKITFDFPCLYPSIYGSKQIFDSLCCGK